MLVRSKPHFKLSIRCRSCDSALGDSRPFLNNRQWFVRDRHRQARKLLGLRTLGGPTRRESCPSYGGKNESRAVATLAVRPALLIRNPRIGKSSPFELQCPLASMPYDLAIARGDHADRTCCIGDVQRKAAFMLQRNMFFAGWDTDVSDIFP